MSESEILDIFNLKPIQDEGILRQIYGDDRPGMDAKSVKCWLSLLPENMSAMVDIALHQERPFQPSDITPEMMGKTNENVPTMNHVEILYRSIAHAIESGDLNTASALVYVVDRAAYRFGASLALLQVLDIILARDPHTAVAPQVIIRKARVMKDSGDLHGAIRILDATITKESVWDYKSDSQYSNVKAVCVQVKGQILHNLGLWNDAIDPLVESVVEFNKLHDDKGTSSSLGLLTRCLRRLTVADFEAVKRKFPAMFTQQHPCYEAYVQGMEAVRFIADLGQTLYFAKHQLVAEESLLMFALQQPPTLRGFECFQTIVTEIKQILSIHETLNNLESTEQFFEFVRGIFLIHLTLYFSPVQQDKSLSKYLEQISIELYRHLCSSQSRRQLVTKLKHTRNSQLFMNATLGILGLPLLQGCDGLSEQVEVSSGPTDVGSNSSAESKGDDKNTEKKLDKSGTVPVQDNMEATRDTNPATFPGAIRTSRGPPSGDMYQRKYIGLPIDAASFTGSSSSESSSSSSNSSSSESPELVNISVSSVSATIEKLGKLDLDSTSEFPHHVRLSKKSPSPKTDSAEQVRDSRLQNSTAVGSSAGSKSDQSGSDSFEKSSSSSSGPSSSSSKSSAYSFCDSDKSSAKLSSGDSSSFVDLSATTDDHYSWCHVTDEIGELSPLVDLSCSTANSSFEDLQLGRSVTTDSPVEYLEHWQPPDVDESIKVNKALLLTYNPVNGDWMSQSTLVHIGRELDLGTNRKGNCRDVFEVSFLHQDEPLGRYVCKRYRQQRPPRYYHQDVVCQMMAGHYVTSFNRALQGNTDDIQVQFLPAAHLQLLTADGRLDDWVNVEPYLHGDFIKLTNNLSFSNKKENRGEELATALTHFSYCESQGLLMIVDIQGWMPRRGKGVVYLTDPQFHTRELKRFSPADRQEEGMQLFWSKVHPKCNRICTSLGLARPE